ncbi:MAG: TonB-dependent receptor [Acidobacteriaceae bacterium]|nr:TonB-dependent receptor [Acidobacteriaceae bacterium]
MRFHHIRPLRHAALLIACTLLAFGSAFAQVAGGTINGTVTDPSHAAIATAEVTITNSATQVTRKIPVNGDGFYSVPNLVPGDYEVVVAATGFETQITKLSLTVGAVEELTHAMTVANSKQQIQVLASPPAVELATSSIGDVVNEKTVRELPLNGRSWTDLANLEPGVSSVTQPSFTTGPARGNRGFGAQLTISGARPQQNNYRLDGISINDYSNGGPGSVLGGNLGVDAIQEFSVLTSNYSTEYGRTSGGVVNAITRSGTNQLHGSFYEFLRNSALDARNFFDTGSPPPFKRNQFGASAGGPIFKDRTFIFGDYEGIRQSLGITNQVTVPSPAARMGQLSTGGVTVDPAAQKYLGLFPLPNGPLLGRGDTGIASFATQQVTNEDFFTLRGDHKFSEKDSIFGTYMYDNANFTTPDNLNTVLIGDITGRQAAVVEETHIFTPSVVNSMRFGVNRSVADNNEDVSAINPVAADSSLGALPGRTAAQLNIPGLAMFAGGLGGTASYYFHFTSFQFYDDAFVTRGLHSLKFGLAVERMRSNILAVTQPNGVFNFGSLSDFLTNRPQQMQIGFANSLTPRGLRATLLGAYIQDDWHARPNLTLNLGLRYEIVTVPTEVEGKLSALRNITDAQPHLGDSYFINPTLRNFEPRVGFSWDPFKDGKTAVRSGFGVFDVLPLPYEFEILSSLTAPFFLNGSTKGALPQGSFPSGAVSLLTPASFTQAYFDPAPRRNYVLQWNANIQRRLANNVTAMVGYVGSRGVHQPFRSDDINMVLPTRTPQGYIWPSPAGSGTVVNPNAGPIRGLFWEGNSFYDALEVQLTKRMSYGFQVQASYTWGKSIDTGSSTVAGNAFANSFNSPHWYDLKLNRGLSDFDIGRTLVLDGVWNIPGRRSGPAWTSLIWTSLIANGWELGGIFRASDGIPFTPLLGGDPLGQNSSAPFDFPNRLIGPACDSLVNPGNRVGYIKTQCFAFPVPATLRGNAGRNIMSGPGLSDFDVSLYKNTPIRRISEGFTTQFRVELFNVLNRANFAPPLNNVKLFDARGNPIGGAGLIDSTVTSSRQIQFALKLIW